MKIRAGCGDKNHADLDCENSRQWALCVGANTAPHYYYYYFKWWTKKNKKIKKIAHKYFVKYNDRRKNEHTINIVKALEERLGIEEKIQFFFIVTK